MIQACGAQFEISPHMKNNRILVVDNEIIMLTMLKSTLSKAGYEVIVASSGTEAVKLAKENLPFVIILDIMMPGMDGGDVADILKNDRKTKDIPIVFLSSLISPREERFSTKKGSISLMGKPYNPDRLLNEVRKHFYGRNPLPSV
jgi:CheY-like chemotaxis protein